MRGRTTLIIAHPLAAVISADRIVVTDHGRTATVGTRGSLVEEDGRCARLAALRFAAMTD